jgi:peptidoglycan-associated lipoprotein
MNQRYSKLMIIGVAAAALLFAGCAKQEVASTTETPQQQTAPVKTMAAKPATNAVYFAFDKSNLDSASRAVLDGYAAYLNDHGAVSITIEGNCDERGSREYNLALGQRRADSVKSYLVDHGVSSNRIDTVSFGEERPVCTGSGEACWAQNRRADIVSR